MMSDLRAELMVQARRPASWLLLAIAVALTVTFAYLVPYAGSRSDPGALTPLLTGGFAGSALGGLPAFTGALALIFGVLVAGGDYGYETWKTVLVQQPSRWRVYAGKAATVAVGTLLMVITLLAVTAVCSLIVGAAEGAPIAWPPITEVLRDLAAGWLVAAMWGMSGVLLAIALRGVALPVGIGLVWMLAVQNLISGLAAPLLDWVDRAQQWLPGGAAGSLVASLGARAGTPGVAELTSTGRSAAVLAAYLAVFTLVAGAVLRRRDLA
jgi:ABC-2 type transport system permease protein